MESDIRYLIEQGKNFFKNQAFKKAEAIFLKIVASKNEFADVYNMLGMIAHHGGQYSRAIDYFQKALKINPVYTEALINLSVLYNDVGEYKLARQVLAKSKKQGEKGERMTPFIKGKLANKHAEVGDVYRGVGFCQRAVQEYQKALELCPHFADIRYRLALSLREEGKKREALKELQAVIREKPGYTDAQVQLGITHYALGEKKEANRVWSRLSQNNPKNQMVRLYLRLTEGTKK